MHVALVVNPGAGKRLGAVIAQRVTARLDAAGHTTSLIHSVELERARGLLKRLVAAGVDRVIVIGGDGTFHSMLDIVASTPVEVGLIPSGTGNDFARAINLDLGSNVQPVDLAHVDGHGFVATVIASGFDSLVNERANQMVWPRGNARYYLAMAAELGRFKPLEFTLTLDGDVIRRDAMLVAVGNGSLFGGGLRICEGASVTDGLLDVVVIRPMSKARFIRLFPRLYAGTHTHLPEFERHRVHEATWSTPGVIAYGDGERLGPLPATTRAAAGALRMLVPQVPA
jgi:diacylglycerol kinase (ATP)